MVATIVATAGSASANSYLTQAEANTYFDSHLYATDWTGAVSDTKDAALIMATRLIDDMYDWASAQTTDTQALRWPRTGILDAGERSFIGNNEIPEELKNATAELAKALIVADRTADSGIEVNKLRALTAGPVSLQFDGGVVPKIVPDIVYFMIPRWWGKVRARRKTVREVGRA